MPNELKPCPFCGSSDVKIAAGTNVSWIVKKYHKNIRAVTCRSCGVFGGIFNTLALSDKEAEKRAVENWNRRANNDNE